MTAAIIREVETGEGRIPTLDADGKNPGNRSSKVTWVSGSRVDHRVRSGQVRFGQVWFGLVWFGLVWFEQLDLAGWAAGRAWLTPSLAVVYSSDATAKDD
jgi:hypothetical protein